MAATIPQNDRAADPPGVQGGRDEQPEEEHDQVGRGELRIELPAGRRGRSAAVRCCSVPMSTMNSPMPMAMPFLMLGLMASISFSRTPSMESNRKITPGIEHHAQADLPGSGRVGGDLPGLDLLRRSWPRRPATC